MTSMELFVVGKKLCMREDTSGFYRVSSDFFGNLLPELPPMRTLPYVTFICIIHSSLGLKRVEKSFFITFTPMVVAYSASSMALVLAAGQSVVSIATLFMTVSFVLLMIFFFRAVGQSQNYCALAVMASVKLHHSSI